MQNSRHKTNPAAQNRELFEVLHVNSVRPAWNTKCDYYIKFGNYRKEGFVLSKTKLKDKFQLGIIIKNKIVIPILESIDFNRWPYKSTCQWNLGGTEIQKAFNQKRLEMGL